MGPASEMRQLGNGCLLKRAVTNDDHSDADCRGDLQARTSAPQSNGKRASAGLNGPSL
jgi:hypothetical protein